MLLTKKEKTPPSSIQINKYSTQNTLQQHTLQPHTAMSFRSQRNKRQMSVVEKQLAREAEDQHNRAEKAAFLQRQARREQRARYERNLQNNRQPRGSWMDERNRQRNEQRNPPARRNPPVSKPTGPRIAQNAFAMLDSDSDSDSDSDHKPVKKVPTPALPSQKTAKQINNSANTWAGFRVKPPTKPTVLKKRAHDNETTEPVATNWAAESDDEEDEEMVFHDRWDSD